MGKKAGAAKASDAKTSASPASTAGGSGGSFMMIGGFAVAGVVCAIAVLLAQGSSGGHSLGKDLEKHFACGARCAAMTPGDRTILEKWLKENGCDKDARGGEPLDDTTCLAPLEQICITGCSEGSTDMAKWIPGAFGAGSPAVAEERLAGMRKEHTSHMQCASKCASEGVLVDVSEPGAIETALQKLRGCGMVQLKGAFDPELLEKVRKTIATLRSQEGRFAALLDREQLRGGRFQLYLPFAAPFDTRQGLGVSDPVLEILTGYFGELGFGIDHVTILTSGHPAENQTLHPDVPYFKRLHLSVHTALDDITYDMGPTYFCPCTGQASEDWAANAAIRLTVLRRKECLGLSYARQLTPKGTVTIYDGVTFHKGLENFSEKDRHLLKLELGSGDYPVRRDYTKRAPREGQKQMEKFRAAFGVPRFGQSAATA
eukprot:gnl/TRDRNA2_/TRDRNA2_165830_c0_seq1.p1 gnl/TRDRNA2_/TRDRNA2_165830_c0~~gnl/TRDRNA2_/TRDRNA2_165830_c0_seq1.p1  ORF type:complete len:430 (+),score=94.83 gnl/TRDRNA2_/TRDRNA2_165830_c0_seq1:52-1341(+)